MKLIIDIDEEAYDFIKRNGYHTQSLYDAIRNGTPLPKGHGRLIDADELKTTFQNHHDFFIHAYGNFNKILGNDKARVDEITHSIAEIVNAPTIIDADRSVEE